MTERGEVYWVDFGPPFGSEPGFRRPALVIQNDVANDEQSTTIVAAVTSRVPPRRFPFIVALDAGEAGLRERSAIRLDQLRTIDQARLEERCGRLSRSRMNEVDDALRATLRLDEEPFI